MKITQTHIVALGLGIIIGGLTVVATYYFSSPTTEAKIAEYYAVENLVSVSPYDIKSALQRNTQDSFVLVDLRSEVEYQEGHITSAINIPNYIDSAISGQSNNERIVQAFAALAVENPGKDIITYCYSAACMASRKVGHALSEHNIFTKHLNIGWYEWKYYWTMWNGEDGLSSEDFITAGNEPGIPNLEDTIISPCAEDSEFGC